MPYGREQLLLGHEPVGVHGQIPQDSKGVGPQREQLASLPQLLVVAVQTKREKVDDGFRLHRRFPL